MEVLLARADFLRRQLPADAAAAAAGDAAGGEGAAGALRAHFRAAGELVAGYFPDYVDRSLRLPAYWAHCEAHALGDAGGARGVWEGVLKGPLAKCARAPHRRRAPFGRRALQPRPPNKVCHGPAAHANALPPPPPRPKGSTSPGPPT